MWPSFSIQTMTHLITLPCEPSLHAGLPLQTISSPALRSHHKSRAEGSSEGEVTRPSLKMFAKVAPILVRMPGLFLVTPSGIRRPFDVTHATRDMTVRLVGSEQLSVGDLEVLLCLIALAGAQSNESYRTTKRYTGRDSLTRMRQMLGRAIGVRTTYTELARELGRSAGGATWPFIRDSITRLSGVWVTARSHCGEEVDSALLLHRSAQDAESRGSVALTLCPVLAAGILGGPSEFIQVDMNTVRAFKGGTGVACALYFRLHGRYADQDHTIPIDSLVELAYGSRISPASLSKYRSRVRNAVQAIAGLSYWKVESKERGMFFFRRSSKKMLATAKSEASMNP